MNTLLKCFIAAIFLLYFNPLQAQLTTGDLSVVGFDADSTDYLAIVNFREIPANTVIYIRDDEWNGTAFTTGEGTLSWTSGATAIAPGTIILLNAMADTAKMSANIGTLKKVSTTNFDMSGNGEGVFLYLGTDANTPTIFLAAIMNGPVTVSVTTLMGTSLLENVTAVILPANTDIGAYKGNRIGLTKEDFLIEIAKTTLANWNLQDAAGNQSTDGIAPDLPFSTSPFTVSFIDNSPPSVTATTVESQTTFKVIFSEKISKATAENKANYVFSPTLTVASVAYDTVNKTATLTTNAMTSGTKYKLTANGFADVAGNLQTVATVIDDLIFNTYAGTGIVISEIMYNVGITDSLEYVEIYNKSTAAIAIGGIKLYGLVGTLPEYSLAPKEAIVIVSDSVRFNRFFNVKALYDWESGFLNNNGGTIGLRNSLGAIIDSVLYGDKTPWDSLPDGRGPSLEIIDPAQDNNVATNWRASTTAVGKKAAATGGTLVDVFGSPGKGNLPSGVKNVPFEPDFTIYPNPSNGEINFSREVSGFVSDYIGRVVFKFDKQTRLNLRQLDNGIYFIKTQGLEKKILIQK